MRCQINLHFSREKKILRGQNKKKRHPGSHISTKESLSLQEFPYQLPRPKTFVAVICGKTKTRISEKQGVSV